MDPILLVALILVPAVLVVIALFLVMWRDRTTPRTVTVAIVSGVVLAAWLVGTSVAALLARATLRGIVPTPPARRRAARLPEADRNRDVMPRLVGVFMAALRGAVVQFLRAGDYRYYTYTIVARALIVAALTALYVKTRDALFVSMDVIVLVGLVPSLYVAARMGRRGLSHP
jgi:hypothetical protein